MSVYLYNIYDILIRARELSTNGYVSESLDLFADIFDKIERFNINIVL